MTLVAQQLVSPNKDLSGSTESNQSHSIVGERKTNVQVHSDVHSISEDLLQAWRTLASNPMASPEWLLAWWKNLSDKTDQLLLISFHVGDKIVGISPLYLDSNRNLQLLGNGRVCTDHSELIICQPESFEFAQQALIQWLTGTAAPKWNALKLEAIGPSSTTNRHIDALSQAPLLARHEDGDFTCEIELPANWEDYVKSLSKNHRKRVRRWKKRHVDSGDLQIRSTDDDWDCSEAFDCLTRLHEIRRSRLEGDGAFDDPSLRSFHREAFHNLAAQGQARISAIFFGGQAMAAEYELVGQATVFAYQSGVDIDLDSTVDSPGSVSVLLGIKSAIDQQKTKFDLMRGDEEYKFHWKAVRKQTKNIVIWPNTVRGHITSLLHTSKSRLRRCVRGTRAWIGSRIGGA